MFTSNDINIANVGFTSST